MKKPIKYPKDEKRLRNLAYEAFKKAVIELEKSIQRIKR